MLTTLNNLPKGQAELTIELSPEELEPYLKKAATNISQAKNIPGFRPGTAPYDIVKTNVGEMTIYQEAAHLAIRKTLTQAIEEKNLDLVTEPQVDILKLAPGNPFTYKATVNLLPGVKIGNYSKIKIKKKEIKVEDDEIKKILKNFQEIFAKEVLSDKEAESSDRVEIDFEVSLDKVVVDGGKQTNYSVIIGQGQMIPGFEEKLIGLKKDEEKEFQLKFPPGYQNNFLAGKTADFKVKIHNIYNRELPEINDELAQKLETATTLIEFKEKIKADLLKDKQAKEDRRAEQEMFEEIIKISEFGEIPDLLVNNEVDKMVEEFRQNIEMNGVDFNQYLQNIKKSIADLKLDLASQAITRLKATLLVQTLTKEKNIKTSEEEIKKEIDHLLGHQNLTAEQKEQINSLEYRHYLESVLSQQKIIDDLKKELIN